MFTEFYKAFFAWQKRQYWKIFSARRKTLLLSMILGCICYPFAAMLYGHLNSSIEELLPKSAPSIKALEVLRSRLGENLQLTLLVSGKNTEELRQFADEMNRRAQNLGPNTPRYIDYRSTGVQDFFKDRKLLFVELSDLLQIEKSIKAKINKPIFSIGLDDEEADDTTDVESITQKYKKQVDQIPMSPSGYYESEEGHSLVMIFYPAYGVTGFGPGLKFRDTIGNLGDQVKHDLGIADLKIEFTGDVEALIQEQRSLESDLIFSSVVVIVAEILLILAFFYWWPSAIALGYPLSIGVLLTFGISWFVVGGLNSSTAFLGSIIVGNGVNASIILLARFIEEIRKGLSHVDAMMKAVRSTYRATFAASLAAALAYSSLMITSFRGYSQFGFIGGIGMLLCWFSTYLLVPPTAVALANRFPVPVKDKGTGQWDLLFGWFGFLSVNKWKYIASASIFISLIAGFAVKNYLKDPFEYDTTKLRSNNATEVGGYLEIDQRAEAIMKRNILPMVVMTKNYAEAIEVSEQYKKLITEKNPNSILGDVFTMDSFVPADQANKLEVMKRIYDEVPEKKRKHLKGETKDYFNHIGEVIKTTPFTREDLPISLTRQFRELDGTLGNLVLLFPKFGTDTKDGRVVLRFANEVRSVPLPQDCVLAGSNLTFADMMAAITKDGPIATLISFICVCLLSLWLARGVYGSVAVTFSLVIGVLWTIAAASLIHMKINFLNFIALPITFGVGLDYAINVFGRFIQNKDQKDAIVDAVKHSGSAVAVCSATTIIGYGSLLFSHNGALLSFGWLAIIGEFACLCAGLIILPALLAWRNSSGP